MNTTNPAKTVSGTATLSISSEGTCVVRVDAPLPETGTFKLLPNTVPVILRVDDVVWRTEFTATDGSKTYVVAERDFAYFLDSKFQYSGIRILLDEKRDPIIRIEDHKDGSLYVDAKTNKTLIEWHTDGKDGYFSRNTGDVVQY